jgi:hypothetical protein
MPELEEQVIDNLEEQRPTDEQANAFLNGDRQAVEQQKEQPQAKAEVVPPAASTAPVQSVDEIKQLKAELNRINSEFGQFRKQRSLESSKPVQPQLPPSWSNLKPEEQTQLKELVKASLMQDEDWQAVQESRQAFQQMQEQQQVSQQVEKVESLAKSFAGDLFKELDPIMGNLYEDFKKKAQEGDEEAAQIVWEARNTRGGIKYLVDLAKQQYSETVQAKGNEAKAQQAATAKKVGVTLGASTQAAPQTDMLKNLPKDPAKAAEMLREELVRRGAL